MTYAPPTGPDPRSTSFGAAADAYERSRPLYPSVAVRDLLGRAPLDVLDVGAGTGKLTRTLLADGHRVHAIDPDPQMLAQLTATFPDVRADLGRAEALPVDAQSFDAVVAGQAYHWFDPDRALPEIARVLRPGGLVGLLWNVRDERAPWVIRFGELVGSRDAGDSLLAPVLTPQFTAAAVRRYEHRQPLTVQGLVDLAASRSVVIGLDPAERADRLAQVEALASETAEDGLLRMPYQLQVWSGRKVG